MRRNGYHAALAAALLLAAPAQAQQTVVPGPPPAAPDLGLRVEIEPAALAIVKAAAEKLAAAHSLSFDAVVTYESPARTGEPLAYTTLSHVALRRPDRLSIISPGDGPPSEFYYDGKSMVAYSPDADLVAISDAPPTVDAMLKKAFDRAAIYYPFADVLVSDPAAAIVDGLKLAFVVGSSKVVGGVETDIVVLANDAVHAQLWIGRDDKLPRMSRATFFNEPGGYRHVVEYSNWRLDEAIPDEHFVSARARAAKPIEFAAPAEMPPEPPAAGSKSP